jgi:hypothetical protein
MANITKEGDDMMSGRKEKKSYIKVKHPDYGWVEFSGVTIRQLDILKEYKRLTNDNIK